MRGEYIIIERNNKREIAYRDCDGTCYETYAANYYDHLFDAVSIVNEESLIIPKEDDAYLIGQFLWFLARSSASSPLKEIIIPHTDYIFIRSANPPTYNLEELKYLINSADSIDNIKSICRVIYDDRCCYGHAGILTFLANLINKRIAHISKVF